MPSSPIKDGGIAEKNNGSKSFFQKTVYLTDWWLEKADTDSSEKRLGVGGFTLRNNVRQEFFSAPIEKVHDVFTLETMDGICIILRGFINKTRTRENGFPSKVFENFVLGFPPHWESFAAKDAWEESPPKAVSEIVLGLLNPSSCSQSVPELTKTRRMNNKDASSEETHGPKCITKSKINSGSKRGNQSEETENKTCLEKSPNKTESISQRLNACYDKQNHSFESGMVVDCRIASAPGSKAKRKLAYESPVMENGKGEASALFAEPSTPNGLPSELRQPTQECYVESIDDSLGGNLEEEISERDNKKDGGVFKVVIQKNVTRAAQSPFTPGGDSHNGKKKTSGRKKIYSINGSSHSRKTKTPGSKKINSINGSSTLGKNRQNGTFTSPQSLSCKRSRSGRLLLPPLAFWRNQIAIYGADREVAGVVDDREI